MVTSWMESCCSLCVFSSERKHDVKYLIYYSVLAENIHANVDKPKPTRMHGFQNSLETLLGLQLGMYTISKVSDRIGIIKLIPVSYPNDRYSILLMILFYDDINKHRVILTQK